MDLSVLFLGTAGSMPTVQRAPASLLIRRGGDRILIDCGEGSQRQLLRSVGLPELEHVFLTHFHADHFLGLPGMMKTFTLRGRSLPLHIYGPRGLTGLVSDLRRIYGKLSYEVKAVELGPTDAVEFGDFRIGAYSVVHRTEALGYALVEDDRPGRFDPARARELGVDAGPMFGELQRGGAVEVGGRKVSPDQVMGESRPGRKLVFTGDTQPCDATVAVAQGAELLVHDGTFSGEEAERAEQTGHSTAPGAARIAAEAGVSLLALTHLSSRYFGPAIEKEAREVFERTVVPRDFDLIEVPYAEKEEPYLVKWKDVRARAKSEQAHGSARLSGTPTAEQIREEIIRLGPWHMDVEVTPEVSTRISQEAPPGTYAESFGPVAMPELRNPFMAKLKRLYPDGLEARTVLDCACNCGGYLFWAREYGAGECFGFDVRDHWIRQARFLVKNREPPSDAIRFEACDLYDVPALGLDPFDITIFDGIFYHLPDPIAGLRIAADLTKELLILGTATCGGMPDGLLAVGEESRENVMDGVHGLMWRPTGPEVLERVLGWAGFVDTHVVWWKQETATPGWGRLEIVAAKTPGLLDPLRAGT